MSTPIEVSLTPNLTPEQSAAVRRAVDGLLHSIEFRSTTRLQHCLRFLVDHVLDGRADHLKERTIGTEVFGRPPDYDTGADAIVRVTANELRKKLAQYYLKADHCEVRIELPSGSYVPKFTWPHPVAELRENDSISDTKGGKTDPQIGPISRLVRSLRPWHFAILAGVGLLAMALQFKQFRHTEVPPLERFWAPVLRCSGPVVICLSNPVVYGLSSEILQTYRREHSIDPNEGPFVIRFKDELVPGRQIIPVLDQYVGNGEAFSLGELTSLFTRLKKPYETRTGGDVSTADLRARAIIFLGFSSRWNLEMNKGLRFTSHIENNLKMIRDSFAPQQSWSLPNLGPDGRTNIDYALVSRMFHSDTGLPVLQACGITQYGCQTAGEFITNPAYFAQVLPLLPQGWEKRNIQIVLTSQILRISPGVPKVVAVHVW